MYSRIAFLLLAFALTLPVVIQSRLSRSQPGQAAFLMTSSARGYVQVLGSVRYPGIYRIGDNIMTGSVINMAAPCCHMAETRQAALRALAIRNGDSLIIRCTPDGHVDLTVGTIPVAERVVLGVPLDINRMTRSDWELLPGVGPALAMRIIAFRQNNGGSMRVEDLTSVDGIGGKRYGQLQKYFNSADIKDIINAAE